MAVGPHPPPPTATAATARRDVRHGVHIGWRRPRRSRAPTLAIGALSVLLAAGRPASAQYLNSYKAGLEAIEAKDWARAAASMHQAIADRKEEKAKLPVRLFLRPYLPHLYLGYARFESGDCAGALAAWAESERQGVAPRLQEFDLARRGRRECGERDQQRALAQARQNAQQSLARTVASGEGLLERSRAAETRDLWTAGDPSAAQRHQRAVGLLEQARALLADAAVDENAIRRAESFVRDADASFTALAFDLDRSIEATRLELAAKGSGIDAQVAAARTALARTNYLAPYPAQLRKATADLEGLVGEAARRDAASQAHLDGLAARLENSIEMLTKLAAAPPDPLERAAQAYLEGRHAEVVERLGAARFKDRRSRAHARLLLAASRHALYLEGGELDSELRDAAAEDARSCHQEDDQLVPSGRFFSPRFVTFFAESIAPAAAPSG